MNTKKWSALLGAVLALGILAGCGGEAPPTPPPAQSAAQTPEPAPEPTPDETGSASALGSLTSFTAGTLDGGSFTQDDIAAMDVTVINFWALTCAPCVQEMPDLAAFAAALPDNVQLITVCLDGIGNEDTVSSILNYSGFDGVTLISGDGDLQSLCGNLMYTPTTVFVNSDGELVGDELIGRQQDLAGSYTAAINKVLSAEGKAEISVEIE